MTRKDYVNIAAAILATQTRIKGDLMLRDKEEEKHQLRGVRRTAAALADFLAEDNPRFDAQQFLTACGYGGEAKPERLDDHRHTYRDDEFNIPFCTQCGIEAPC